MLVCAFLYWACWYAVVGFSFRPEVVGPVYLQVRPKLTYICCAVANGCPHPLQMTLYEFLYTGIGQMIAAYSPNAVFAALVNPLVISILVTFSGVLVPFPQITAFWRYCKRLLASVFSPRLSADQNHPLSQGSTT